MQNVKLFPTDLPTDVRWGFMGIWHISLIVQNNPATFEFTVDGGTTWFPLNPVAGVNTAIPADDERIFQIKADDKELFNLRCTDASGCDVYRALVAIAPQDVMRPRSDLDVNVPTPLDVNITGPNPLPVDICPVTCEIDVDLNSISFGDIPVINGATPLTVTWPTALPVDICPVTCEIDVDINSISFGDIPVVNGASTFNVNVAGQVGADPLNVSGTFSPDPQTEIDSIANLARGANVDWFASDLNPTGLSAGEGATFRCHFAMNSSERVEYTLNGTDYVDFSGGFFALSGNAGYTFDIPVLNGDDFNIRAPTSTTVIFCRVTQIIP